MKDLPDTDCLVIGGGCFWCIQAVFKRIPGVLSAAPGYSGGTTQAPSYEQVCLGNTGHAEVVELRYDRTIISLDQVLDTFFSAHNPTTKNRQGSDVGTQYRSVIFFTEEDQKNASIRKIDEINSSKKYASPVVTQVAPLEEFWRAEEYHNDYYEQHPFAGYCRVVIAPKLGSLGLPQNAQAI
jgi:peptide-methionine (S)-S-oxide reductase